MTRGIPDGIPGARSRRSGRHAAVGLAVMLAVAGLAAEPAVAGDPKAGRGLAQTWCANCHLIGGRAVTGTTVSDVVPSFTAIAADPDKGRDWIGTWLATPHANMPQFDLSRREIDDLASYIETLAR